LLQELRRSTDPTGPIRRSTFPHPKRHERLDLRLADAERMQIEINNPMSGDELMQLIRRLQNSKPEVVKRAAEAIRAQLVEAAGNAVDMRECSPDMKIRWF